MAVKERGNEVIFLRQVVAGGAERSFGIHVARLAGLHTRIISRAEEMLKQLEARATASEQSTLNRGQGAGGREQSPGGDATDETTTYVEDEPEAPVVRQPSAVIAENRMLYAIDEHHANGWREVIRELAQVDIANMTPVQALVLLNELQGRVRALSADSESG